MKFCKKIKWIVKFVINDLNKNVKPHYGMSRWQLIKSDVKFIWNTK